MTIDLLKANIEKEKEIVIELLMFSNQLAKAEYSGARRQDIFLLESSINNLVKQLSILNNAVPGLVKNIGFYKKLDLEKKSELKLGSKNKSAFIQENHGKQKKQEIIKVQYNSPDKKGKEKVELAIAKKDKVKFLESIVGKKEAEKRLNILRAGLSSSDKLQEEYVRISNKYFRSSAEKLIEKGYFDNISRDLRKIISSFLLNSYVSVMFFSTALSAIAGFFIFVVLLLSGASVLVALFALFAIPLTVFLLFFTYPSTQRSSLEKEINQELPFVTIYMAAVATSGIEPSRVFSILVRTKDYPFVQREIKRLLNYINFYGYDLVSALRQSAKLSSSEKLSMLFSGLATTITSGGELAEFLNKHAESMLFDYRLEREKYTKMAETFMDIYISILIAAPMILMILLILLSLTGYGSGFLTPTILTFSIISVISILNIGFLVFLNLKQPKF